MQWLPQTIPHQNTPVTGLLLTGMTPITMTHHCHKADNVLSDIPRCIKNDPSVAHGRVDGISPEARLSLKRV